MKKGFTLIELSIVLIIIGLLTGGAFQMIKVMQEKARATEAKQTLESAKQAVIAYTINNGKLPTETDFFNMQIRGADNFNLAYYVPTTTTNPPNFLITNLCANIDTGFSTQITKPDNTLEIPTPNIAFVIAINGENMQPQTIPATVTSPLIFPRWNAIAMGFPYDDLHVQVTLGELQSNAGCLPLKIINPQLPVGTVNTSYSAQISSEGGAGGYTYTYIPSLVGGYTLPSNGNISHIWTTAIPPTAIDISVHSGTATATRRYVLQIDDPNSAGGGGTIAYQQCVDNCFITKPNNPQGCISSTCK